MGQQQDSLTCEGGGKHSKLTQSPLSKADQRPASLHTMVTLEANALLLTLPWFLCVTLRDIE